MAQATWEKSSSQPAPGGSSGGRLKFLVGGLLILAAVAYLIVSGTIAGSRYYITVDELLAKADYQGKNVRMAGVVLGDTIVYDEKNLILEFSVANVPMDYTDLAVALHEAATNPDANRVLVRLENQPKPDLLRHEAQAIVSGELDPNGVFHASELNLKCPTRFEEAQPGQEIANPAV